VRALRCQVRRDEHILQTFNTFRPYSGGDDKSVAALTVLAVNQTFPHLERLVAHGPKGVAPAVDLATYCGQAGESPEAAARLGELFEEYGSDKSTRHNYHRVYAVLLKVPASVRKLVEIGIGSNHPSAVSNMGPTGRPGASLRGWADYLPAAQVYGADYDRDILFSEDRITTCYLDQTDVATFDELAALIGHDADIIIDDGLHAINANLAVLVFALDRVRIGGWIVIEDIHPSALGMWQVVSALMPEAYQPTIVRDSRALMFVVQRVS
jgi:hypothetical protein